MDDTWFGPRFFRGILSLANNLRKIIKTNFLNIFIGAPYVICEWLLKVSFHEHVGWLQVFLQAGHHATECLPPNEFQNSVTAWQSCNPKVSLFPSYSMGEDNLIDELSLMGCMSPYPKPMAYDGVFSNEDTQVQNHIWAECPRDINPMSDGMIVECLLSSWKSIIYWRIMLLIFEVNWLL